MSGYEEIVDGAARLRMNITDLPVEIIDYIGQILIDDYQFGTVAALNVCSKDVHAATNLTLWTTLILDASKGIETFIDGTVWNQLIKSSSRRYTGFLKIQLPSLEPVDRTMETAIFYAQAVLVFPKLAAIVFSHLDKNPANPTPHSQSESYLMTNYRVNTIHDILFWAVMNSDVEADEHYVFIKPPSSPFQNAGGSSIIPFTPKKRSRIQSITLWKRKPNKHVPESLLTTFGACLALACYSGRHQNPDRSLLNDEKGKEDLIRPVALVVNLEEDSKVLQKCLQVLSEALSTDRHLVLFPLRFIHWLDRTDSSRARGFNNDNLESAIQAAQVLLHLRSAYQRACTGMSGKKVPGLMIIQEEFPGYQLVLGPMFKNGKAVPKLKVIASAEGIEGGQEEAIGVPTWRSLTIDLDSL